MLISSVVVVTLLMQNVHPVNHFFDLTSSYKYIIQKQQYFGKNYGYSDSLEISIIVGMQISNVVVETLMMQIAFKVEMRL